MRQLMRSSWSNEDGHRDWRTQHGCTYIDSAHIDQHARAQTQASKRRTISLHRHLIVTPSLIIVPDSMLQTLMGERFIIEKIDGTHRQAPFTTAILATIALICRNAPPPCRYAETHHSLKWI